MPDHQPTDFRRHFPSWPFVGLAGVLIGILSAGFVYFGLYDIGADKPHTMPVHWVIENLRDRSISVRAHGIVPPSDLNDPKRIATGAGLYTEMCSGCHLAPGMEKTEISQGLYPPAPELSRGVKRSVAEQQEQRRCERLVVLDCVVAHPGNTHTGTGAHFNSAPSRGSDPTASYRRE